MSKVTTPRNAGKAAPTPFRVVGAPRDRVWLSGRGKVAYQSDPAAFRPRDPRAYPCLVVGAPRRGGWYCCIAFRVWGGLDDGWLRRAPGGYRFDAFGCPRVGEAAEVLVSRGGAPRCDCRQSRRARVIRLYAGLPCRCRHEAAVAIALHAGWIS
ncbi:MAG: hypothetical protein U0797_12930 [Gemmataceae bacterium]